MEKQIIYRIISYGLLILTIVSLTSLRAEDEWVPEYLPELEVKRCEGAIKADGDLSDPGWRNAATVSKFHEHFPGDQTDPAVKTVAMITYDDNNLYVAFICYDNPADIHMTYSQRDRAFQDDNVLLALDTYGDGAWAYEIGANAYGIQVDFLWSRSGNEDSSYDLIWESGGMVTDSGYQVEMKIPFSSLRFPNVEEQHWRADFWRNHPRDLRRQMSWAAYDRDITCWPCQWGYLKGIKGVKSGKGIELIPAVVASQSGELNNSGDSQSGFNNDDIDGDFGLSAKYSISSNVTAEATYNPDFSQVESDATQIDVNTTFALSYPEKRPFFQEGSDLFKSWFSLVYTRQINDPQFAGKVIGRFNRTNLGLLTAFDEHSPLIIPFEERSALLINGKSISNIFRARQTFGKESHFGMLMTDRRYTEGGSGTVLSADAMFKISKMYQFEIQLINSYTAEPDDTTITSGINDVSFNNGRHTASFDGESYWGHGVYASFERHAQTWWFDLDYTENSPTARYDNGFITSNNFRMVDLESGLNIYVDHKILAKINPYIGFGRKWNFSKERKDEWFRGSLGFQLIGQTWAEVSYLGSWEKLRGIEFPGIKRFSVQFDSRFSEPIWLGAYYSFGRLIARNVDPDPIMGDEMAISIWSTIKPINQLTLKPSFDYVKSDSASTGGNIFEGYAWRVRTDYQILRELSFRFVTQYNDFSKVWEFDPLITYRLNPFTLFYIGSTHDIRDFKEYDGYGLKQMARQYFLKIQYLIQV